MAIEAPGTDTITLLAAADLSAKQYYLAKISTAGLAALGTAGAACIGPIKEPNTSGGEVGIVISGIYPVIYGGSVTAGDALASDSTGKAVTAVGGDYVIGIALETGSANEIRSMVLLPKGPGSYPAGEQGDILYYNGSNWVVLHHGTLHQLLETGGHAANPAWATQTGWFIFYIPLANIADGDLLTGFVPGFAGTITALQAAVEKAVTTADKLSTLNLEIGSTNLTGGVLALTSANCTPKGAIVAASAITANNVFTDSDAISIEASSTTTFNEGSIWLMIKYTRP